MTRDAHALAILGPELYSRLPKLRVLVVGSGGIGCELRQYNTHIEVPWCTNAKTHFFMFCSLLSCYRPS